MKGRVKYLVQVQCEPWPEGLLGQSLLESLGDGFADSFRVTGRHCAGPELTLEISSSHPLAYGVFKDLADLVKQTLVREQRRLRSGAVYRVHRHPLAAALEAFAQGPAGRVGGAGRGAFIFWSAALAQRVMDGLLGGARLSPEMYFYGEVSLDLALSARARRLALRAAPEGS